MKRSLLTGIALAVLFVHLGSLQSSPQGASPFTLLWDDAPIERAAGEGFEVKVTIRVPEGHYIYAEETQVDFVSLEGLIIKDIRYPKSVPHDDPYLGKRVDVYEGDAVISIIGNVPEKLKAGEHDLVAVIGFRGCSPSLCYRPQEEEISFKFNIAPPMGGPQNIEVPREVPAGGAPSGGLSGLKELFASPDFSDLLRRGMGLTIILVLIAGLLTSLTPCVWPVIPVVLLFVGVHPHKRFWQNLLLSTSLVMGLIFVYAILGVVAVAAGKNLGFLFQQRLFLALVVIFFLAMSFSMFGVFDIRLPSRLQHRLHRLGGEGYRGAFLAGMGMGLVASPCAGPMIASLLGYVALQRNYVLGFALLVVYGLGMGLFMILLGALYGEMAGKLKSGPWMVWIRRTLGIFLLFPAAFYMGSLFHWGDEHVVEGPGEGGIEWFMDEAEALKEAAKSGRPIMLEFGADWCPPCKALERGFFRREDVIALSRGLVALHVDATVETNEVRRLVGKFGVIGWPSVIYMDSHGRQFEDLRVNDYDPKAIEDGMREAIARSR